MKNFTRLSLIALLCFSSFFCKKNMDATSSMPPPINNNIKFKKLVILFNNDLKTQLALLLRVPKWKLDVYAYGSKNIQGTLSKLNEILIVNPVNQNWMDVTFTGNYPSRIKTNAGIITQFSNYNRDNLTVDITITDSANNKIIKTINSQKLSSAVFNEFDTVTSYLSQQSGLRTSSYVTASPCQKANKTASYISTATSAIGCVIGLAGIAETAGISFIVSGVGTIFDCLSAVDGIVSIILGDDYQPFTCDEQSVGDAAGIASGCLVAPSGSPYVWALNCGTNILGYGSDAFSCQGCDSIDHPARSTGDPHLTTMDGLKYNFQGYGEFVALKSTTDNFEIQARQVDVYNTNRVTLNTAVAVRTGSDVICALVNPLRLYRNNIKLPSDFGTITLADGSTLFRNGIDIKLTTVQGDVILIHLRNSSWLLDYMITLAASRKGKVTGIFGNFDGNQFTRET